MNIEIILTKEISIKKIILIKIVKIFLQFKITILGMFSTDSRLQLLESAVSKLTV